MFCEDSFNPSNIRTQREVTQPLLLDSIRVSTVPQMIILDNRLHWFLLGVSVIVLETTGSTALYHGSMPGTGFTVVIMMVALQNCSPGFYCVSVIPHRTGLDCSMCYCKELVSLVSIVFLQCQNWF